MQDIEPGLPWFANCSDNGARRGDGAGKHISYCGLRICFLIRGNAVFNKAIDIHHTYPRLLSARELYKRCDHHQGIVRRRRTLALQDAAATQLRFQSFENKLQAQIVTTFTPK